MLVGDIGHAPAGRIPVVGHLIVCGPSFHLTTNQNLYFRLWGFLWVWSRSMRFVIAAPLFGFHPDFISLGHVVSRIYPTVRTTTNSSPILFIVADARGRFFEVVGGDSGDRRGPLVFPDLKNPNDGHTRTPSRPRRKRKFPGARSLTYILYVPPWR